MDGQRTFPVVEMNPSESGTRCYKCQKYRHIEAKRAASKKVCVRCEHKTKKCKTLETNYACPNCKMNHRAGDHRCPTQVGCTALFHTVSTNIVNDQKIVMIMMTIIQVRFSANKPSHSFKRLLGPGVTRCTLFFCRK